MKQNYLYIHIPFCESKCKYCRFASFGSIQKLQIEKYVHFLCTEIGDFDLVSSGIESKIETIYFGGGTPSTLSKQQLEKIFLTLRSKFIFSENIEITFESTPSKIEKQNLEDWYDMGITRLSFGVQTLNRQSIREIDRENKGDVLEKLDILSDFQKKLFENQQRMFDVSLDFIIGLPYVKKGEVSKDIEFISKKYNFVNHFSVYMLEEYYEAPDKIEAYDSKFENITYPNNWSSLGIGEEEYLGEYLEVKSTLEYMGFARYELSNYSKEGKECRHNQAYWTSQNILAFGLSASGYYNKQRYTNSAVFSEYYNKTNIFTEHITPNDIFLETCMFQLRTSGFTSELYSQFDQKTLKHFLEDQYLEKKSKNIVLGDKGIMFLDYILGELI